MAVVRPWLDQGMVLVPPYDDPAIIAGQGTIGLELMRQARQLDVELDAVVMPCGGGGLSSGISIAVKDASPKTEVWGAEPEAAAEDVLSTWHQLVTLHRKEHSLLRELKDAELALSEAPTDANFVWLKDVSARLESMEGTEALIEGFGESSGRVQTTT